MKKRSKGRRNTSGKIQYKINNWREYNESLKNRGSLTVWISKDIGHRQLNKRKEIWYLRVERI